MFPWCVIILKYHCPYLARSKNDVVLNSFLESLSFWTLGSTRGCTFCCALWGTLCCWEDAWTLWLRSCCTGWKYSFKIIQWGKLFIKLFTRIFLVIWVWPIDSPDWKKESKPMYNKYKKLIMKLYARFGHIIAEIHFFVYLELNEYRSLIKE